MSGQRATVIGAGVGGLTAAMKLAHAGFEVDLFEKQPGPGGHCGRVEFDGFRFDLGPTILLMPHVLEETFASVGVRMSDVLELQRCDPHYRVHYRDGSRFTLWSDPKEMRAELERIEPGSHARYEQFLAHGRQQHDTAFERFVTKHFDSLSSFVTPSNVPEIIRVGALKKLWKHVSGYFTDERLLQALSFQTMYLGISPWEAPAVFSLLPYTEATHGIWFPKGGLHAVPLALEKVCREKGVRLHYGKSVKRVHVEGGVAKGVALEDGTIHRSDVVLTNADYAYAVKHLLPESKRVAEVEKKRFTSSGLMLYLGLKQKVDPLLHHNVFFGRDFEGSFEDIFEKKRVPADVSFYVNAPEGFAPEGKEALYVLVPVPHQSDSVDWKVEGPRVRAQVLKRLEEEGYGNLESLIESERMITPDDWAADLNLARGSNFGLAQNFWQIGPFRPQVTDPEVKNLYWCGASIQPGTGVPTVMLSAKFAVEAIQATVSLSPAGERAYPPLKSGYASAREVTKHHAKSFFFSSIALFGARRRGAFALYAFCRRLDDLVDQPGTNPKDLPRLLDQSRELVHQLFTKGEVKVLHPWPEDELHAFQDTISRYGITQQPFLDLIDGMEMDLTIDRYRTWADLDLYCYRVAGTVGLMMAPLLGTTNPTALRHAADLGRAMQLTNILRDVREDLGRGRLYLPQEDLETCKVTEADLRKGTLHEGTRSLITLQITRARSLYASAQQGVPWLSGLGSQRVVRLMGEVYGGILDVIEERNLDLFSARASLPTSRKLLKLAKVMLTPNPRQALLTAETAS